MISHCTVDSILCRFLYKCSRVVGVQNSTCTVTLKHQGGGGGHGFFLSFERIRKKIDDDIVKW
jgi:hypothetical protein